MGRERTVLDYASLAAELFGPAGRVTKATSFFYYLSVFLQMANYLIVLSHTLQAVLAGAFPLCRPWAGVLSAAITFLLNQLPSMAALGRGPATASVVAVVTVAILCVTPPLADDIVPAAHAQHGSGAERVLTVSAAIGGITFAVSPTLVMLNSRHAMARPEQLPTALLLGVGSYTLAFFSLVLCAGEAPPAFLFDLIPEGPRRRVTSSLLFAHVAVSYAISSVALCSAADRHLARRHGGCLYSSRRARWAALTTGAMVAAWLVANAAPFFDGLVELIGSICLTSFFLPALLCRKAHDVSKWPLGRAERAMTAGLMVMAIVLTTSGLTGAVVGIAKDWKGYGPPFACHALQRR